MAERPSNLILWTAVSDPAYALGRSADEHQRLRQQAAIVRPLTERFFREAGIRPGMRVLDIGSGVGDVALLAAEMVGPTGEVLGIDVDGAALEIARSRGSAGGYQNVRFIQGEIRSAQLPGTFDAAVGRLILLYFGDPAEALRAAANAVRSGGTIAFQEMDMVVLGPRSYPESDSLWNAVGRAITEVLAAAGVHVRMGRMLLDAYAKAGLPAPALYQEAVVGGGAEFPGYEWLANTLRSLMPMAQKLAVTSATEIELDGLAERIRDDAMSRNLMVWSPPFIGAVARKP
jgi:ubiquinone/menaquinone biosynthesis C-methylase UbiE